MQRLWHLWRTVSGVIFRHPVPGVTIIPIQDDGRVVLVKRRDTQQWSLPGGMVDWGQDLRTTVQRELAEETGLSVKHIGRLVGVYSSPTRDPRIHSICAAVEVFVQGVFVIEDTNEVAAVQAFTREEVLLENLSHDHGRQLQDYWSGQTSFD